MKKRKNMFALAIVALILVLGVGYAVVSTVQLTINGEGKAKTEDLKVVYDGVNAWSGGSESTTTNATTGAKLTALVAVDDTRAATFKIEDMVLNKEEYAEFEIKNKETDVDATIKVPTTAQFTNSKSEFFEAKLYYNGTEWTTDQTLAAGETAKVKVVVKLKKTPVESGDSSTTISVTYDAEPKATS